MTRSALYTISEVAGDWHELQCSDAKAHYAAIRCPRKRIIEPAVQPADIPPPQSATLSQFVSYSVSNATHFQSRGDDLQ